MTDEPREPMSAGLALSQYCSRNFESLRAMKITYTASTEFPSFWSLFHRLGTRNLHGIVRYCCNMGIFW